MDLEEHGTSRLDIISNIVTNTLIKKSLSIQRGFLIYAFPENYFYWLVLQ